MRRVFLEPRELDLARRLADRRQGSKHTPVNAKTYSRNNSPWEGHYMGLQGEIAVAKLVRFPINESISPDGDGSEPDLWWKRDRVEVKTTRYNPPIMKFDKLTDFEDDICFLCCMSSEGVIDVAGYIRRADFYDCHTQKDFGFGIRACVGQESLTTFDGHEF